MKTMIVLAAAAVMSMGMTNTGHGQAAAPAAAAPAAEKVDYSKKVKVLLSMFRHTQGEWQVQLKNTTKEPITLETLGISIKDARGLEVERGGVRNVLLKPGIVVFLKGKVDRSQGNVDFRKGIKAEVIYNPENPDTYIK